MPMPQIPKERTPLPVFEWIFCARSDRSLSNMLTTRLYQRFENPLDQIIALEKLTRSQKTINTHSKPTSNTKSPKHTLTILIESSKTYRPTTKFHYPKPQKPFIHPPINNSPVATLLCPPVQDHFLNQSSWIQFRPSAKKLNKRNISFDSDIHNIYDPDFSSESSRSSVDNSSLEISFELNDSYEELTIDRDICDNREIALTKQQKKIIQPVFSVSPKKPVLPKGIYSQNDGYTNITTRTRQDSGKLWIY